MKMNLLSGAIATTYLLVCSSLYLWIFWLHFDINILQFIDVSDIIKASALPAIPLVCITLVSIFLQQYNIVDTDTRKQYKAAGGGFKVYSYFATFYILCILTSTAVILGIAVYNAFTGNLPSKYASVALLISCFAAYYLMFQVKLFEELGKPRFIIIAFLCYFPTHFMNKAIGDATSIIDGQSTYLISSNLSCSKNDHEKFRYIATLSDKVFSINLANNSLCIQKYEFLTLTKEQNAKPLEKIAEK
ncbi:hypothetical protein [Citrobacter sp. Cpo015]|uniref:hypothetical protein n=1 Tax=Citrobacter sp. Cpo015 TaxID=2985121 RepID=UPI002574CC93|nr:hypothetical protein [Citrobacter sp. Cpo015]MDM2906621.1 hypothetical protein [Citrobacter sp. Cpo015]